MNYKPFNKSSLLNQLQILRPDTFEGVLNRESRSIITGVYFSQTSVSHFTGDLVATLSACP